MKIALINENSQAAKNEMIAAALKKVVEPMGYEVFNYGMHGAEDAVSLTYVQNGILAAVLLRLHKIVIIQAVCGLLLLTFLSIVFGSTVFTRTPGIRQYQPEVFWSWKEILGIGTCGRLGSTTGDGLLQENLLNILLLFPAGILLPGVTGRKLKWWMGLLVGIAVSSAIEISQLLLCRGLFEFDDIIHNSLGCMLGSLLGNRMLRLVHGK